MAKSLKEWELQSLLWEHFDWKRSREMGGDVRRFMESFINFSRPPGSSPREDIQEMSRAATPPFEIVRLSERLDEMRWPRGKTYFGWVGRKIDEHLRNYEDLCWWLEKGGLVIDTIAPDESQLSEFDRVAGKLVYDGTQNGRLSADTIRQIADDLDEARFTLAENLQPAQWKPIANHNQKFAKKAIKTFAAAVSNPRLVYYIRRRLYVARERYLKVHGPIHR